MRTDAARIGVDVGGTFTDVILHDADGRVLRKLLSTPPVLERRGSLTALVTTAGFRDVLREGKVSLERALEEYGWRP